MNTLAPSFLIGSSSFLQVLNEDMHESLDEFNILKTNRQIKTKLCKHIVIDKIYVGIVNLCFLQICNRVTVLD